MCNKLNQNTVRLSNCYFTHKALESHVCTSVFRDKIYLYIDTNKDWIILIISGMNTSNTMACFNLQDLSNESVEFYFISSDWHIYQWLLWGLSLSAGTSVGNMKSLKPIIKLNNSPKTTMA